MILTGKQIKLIRIEKGILQKVLAERLGVSRVHLSMVESEKRDGLKARYKATVYFQELPQTPECNDKKNNAKGGTNNG